MSGRLIVFAGLPGTGKSTLARILAEALPAFLIRIDTIEQAFLCGNKKGRYKACPTWKDVVGREHAPWIEERTVIDTAYISPDDALQKLIGYLQAG
jgi:adenylate kinase family enzyme